MITELQLGTECPDTSSEEGKRISDLRDTVEYYLPTIAERIRTQARKKQHVGFHQDAFASGYDHDEYILLGMVIKYAGLMGVGIVINGTNKETFGPNTLEKQIELVANPNSKICTKASA